MNSNLTSLLALQHQADPIRTVSHDRRRHSQPHTRGDSAPTRWISLAHAALNQAKMAARAQQPPLPVPQPPAAPDRVTIGDLDKHHRAQTDSHLPKGDLSNGGPRPDPRAALSVFAVEAEIWVRFLPGAEPVGHAHRRRATRHSGNGSTGSSPASHVENGNVHRPVDSAVEKRFERLRHTFASPG
jgi:hypothetical protein